MTGTAKSGDGSGWICNRCRVPLEVQTVRLQYRKTIFALHLPVCPGCSSILIDEELATGKMAEAEQIIEDK
jgi:predicted  nucleic acid-binding Zn-ribbon protein